jgi:hypothetical protein
LQCAGPGELVGVGNAARAEAEAQGLDPKAVEDSVAFLTDMSYRTGATDIVKEVCAAIPDMKSRWSTSRARSPRLEMAWRIS